MSMLRRCSHRSPWQSLLRSYDVFPTNSPVDPADTESLAAIALATDSSWLQNPVADRVHYADQNAAKVRHCQSRSTNTTRSERQETPRIWR